MYELEYIMFVVDDSGQEWQFYVMACDIAGAYSAAMQAAKEVGLRPSHAYGELV